VLMDLTTFPIVLEEEIKELQEKYRGEELVTYYVSWRHGHACPQLIQQAEKVIEHCFSRQMNTLHYIHYSFIIIKKQK
jgi:hypothetical protein